MSHLGATFYPGTDDYYMPEVVAPAPQRVMPEVPQNMQQDLQRMELEARSPESRNGSIHSSSTGGAQSRHGREPSLSTVLHTGYGQQYQQQQKSPQFKDMRELPSFSPFPKVEGEHIPPGDDEKEAVLAESRQTVLHSNDPDMQICWARDVLAYVEIASEAAARDFELTQSAGSRDPRPVTPKIEHELRMDALNIINYLAEQKHPEAVFIKGKWWEFGRFGFRQDKKQAWADYDEAARAGWGRADYRIGMLYENSNDAEKALRHYEMGLQVNDSAASYRLGMIYLMGQHNQPRDIQKGLELIHDAAGTADEDAPQGAFVYGMLIARDLPDVSIPEGLLPTDINAARKYIEKAAYLGFGKAQLKMGQAYELCQLGCEFSPALSLHYYGLAARQGQPEACLGVSRWFLFGYDNTFAKNEQLAYKYAQLAAKQKLPTGEFAMGYYNEIGIYVEKNLREARKWYELAAEHGNTDAVGRLDGLSHANPLSKADHETTTLTRIKSQYGSQRGKRPDRLKQTVAGTMPALSERESPRPSPGASPHPSPRTAPYDNADPSDPRGPAFGINLASRPKSSVPYPEDDRPNPLTLPRARSAAPYPEDDMRQPHSPHYNAGMRPSADRPGSAFGIRPQPAGPGGPGMRPSQSTGQMITSNLIPPAGMDPNRNRPSSAGWGAQPPQGYRGSYDQRLPVGPPQGSPGHGRQNPHMPPQNQYPPGGGYGLPSGPQAGRGGYGGRMSQDSYGGRSSAAPGMQSPTMSGGGGPPHMGNARPPQPPMKQHTMDHLSGNGGGRSSAPPTQARPNLPSPAASTSTTASAATAPAGPPSPSPSQAPLHSRRWVFQSARSNPIA
ncbi:NAD-dependent epimerase/dehydratase terH [Apiospora hydei]|uniref:NAD-dependent epimerase/dehydratase terH n=1 Tax=Apiospora hydei TaxID=1337664 RepID=A0ABR1X8I8_9PEZI